MCTYFFSTLCMVQNQETDIGTIHRSYSNFSFSYFLRECSFFLVLERVLGSPRFSDEKTRWRVKEAEGLSHIRVLRSWKSKARCSLRERDRLPSETVCIWISRPSGFCEEISQDLQNNLISKWPHQMGAYFFHVSFFISPDSKELSSLKN